MEADFPFAAQWVLPSEYGQEKKIMRELAAIVSMDPLFTRLDDMLTVVTEACLNAFEHGNGLNGSLPVQVGMTIDEIRYLFRISDEGNGFELPVRRACPHLEEYRGWGLCFIEALADRWAYGRSDGKFYIEFEFNRSG